MLFQLFGGSRLAPNWVPSAPSLVSLDWFFIQAAQKIPNMLNLQHRDLAFFDKALCFVKLRLGGKKYAQHQPFKCMMIHRDILWTMKKKLKNDASNSFCVLALSIHCFKIFVWIACHGDSKSDIWRYTLVHNFCPPLSWTIEIKLL